MKDYFFKFIVPDHCLKEFSQFQRALKYANKLNEKVYLTIFSINNSFNEPYDEEVINSVQDIATAKKRLIKSFYKLTGTQPMSGSVDFISRIHTLDLRPEQTAKIKAIHLNVLKPEHFKSVKNWINQCYNRPSDDELRICAYNEILEGYGIESHTGEWQNGYWCNIEFTYVNMGDSYISTIVHHREKGWLITSYGDLLESVHVK